MKRIIVILLLSMAAYTVVGQTYDPTKATVSNKPYGASQAIPTDARSFFYDGTNFLWRPYQSITEVKTFLNLAKYRTGNFLIVVDSGGTLNGNGTYTGGVNTFWMFKDGVLDANLVELNLFGGGGGGGSGTVTNVSSTTFGGITLTISNPTTTPNITPSVTLGGDISGSTLSAVTVAKLNGQLPSYYLNYNNLFNTPTIPAQFNPIAGTGISLSGSYPNITFTASGTGGFSLAGYGLLAVSGSTVAIDSLHYRKVDSIYTINDSTVVYLLNGIPDTLSIRGGTGSGGGGGSGTVTNFSFVNANGITGSVTNPTSIPALTLNLTNIAPTTVNGLTLTALSTGFTIAGGTTSKTLTVPLDATISGTNTGNVTLTGRTYLTITGQQITEGAIDVSTADITGILKSSAFPALTGDVTTSAGSVATTISNGVVTYAKMQNETSQTFLGRYAGTSGSPQEGTFASYFNLNTSTGLLTLNGISSFTQGDIIYASAANTLTVLVKSSTANRWLNNGGTSNNPTWAALPTDTVQVVNYGSSAVTLLRGSADTLYSNSLAASTDITPVKQTDSTVKLFLTTTGVGAASYTLLNGTVDANGRLTAASSGGTGITNYSSLVTNGSAQVTSQAVLWHLPMDEATAAALATNTYNNGTSGVGATLTCNTNGALTVDGVTVATNDRVLVKNEATASHNGIYTVTQTGGASTPYILTRGVYASVAANMTAGSGVYVKAGTANAGLIFAQTTTGAITFGTTSLVYAQIGGGGGFTNPMTTTNDMIVQAGGTYARLVAPAHNGMKLTSVGGSLGWVDSTAGGGGNPFSDASALVKNSSDATKLLILSAASVTTGTTRTLTAQNASYTLAGTNFANTFTSNQTVSGTFTASNAVVSVPNIPFTANNNKLKVVVEDTTTGNLAHISYFPIDTTGAAAGSLTFMFDVGSNSIVLGNGTHPNFRNTSTVSANTSFNYVAGDIVDYIIVTPTSNTTNFQVGTTSSGSDIVPTQSLTGGQQYVFDIGFYSAGSSTLYFQNISSSTAIIVKGNK